MTADKKSDGRRFNKTPDHTKFKKGQSGNPSGKSNSDEMDIDESLRQVSGEYIFATASNGKRVKLTKAEAAAHQLVNAALKEDSQAIRECLRLMRKLNAIGLLTAPPVFILEGALTDMPTCENPFRKRQQ